MLVRSMGISKIIKAINDPRDNPELRTYAIRVLSEFAPSISGLQRKNLPPYKPHQRYRFAQFLDFARIYDTTCSLRVCPVHHDLFNRAAVERYIEQDLVTVESMDHLSIQILRVHGYTCPKRRRPFYGCVLTEAGEHRLKSIWDLCFPKGFDCTY